MSKSPTPITMLEATDPIDICVAMPTYDSADIIWLQLESLCRQKTEYNWEVIICEEDSKKYFGSQGIIKYIERLKKAGCKRIVYIELSEHIPLSQKWVIIANEAKGSSFLLTASDNYSPPNRLTLTHNKLKENFNWVDIGAVLFLHLFSFKKGTFKSGPKRPGPFKGTKTHYIKKLKGPWPIKGIDTWICAQQNIRPRYKHPTPLAGLCTDGVNKISLKRASRYIGSGKRKGFSVATQSLNEILPRAIKRRLKKQFYTG